MNELGTLGGLRIESDFPLVGLAKPDPRHIELGNVRIRRATLEEIGDRKKSQPGAVQLEPGALGTFLITKENEILVVPGHRVADAALFAFLFGPCFGVIAYLNRILPLHASSIETGLGCVGFVGRSGAGKSTMVAALARRGHRIHSDDVCLVRRMPNDEILSWPSARWMRLTDATAKALRIGPSAPPPPGKKHSLALTPTAHEILPRIARAIYVLEESAAGESASVTRLRGVRAAERVIANAYRPAIAQRLGLWRHVLPFCTVIAERIPVFILRRALDFTQLDRTLDFVERHIHSESTGDGAC